MTNRKAPAGFLIRQKTFKKLLLLTGLVAMSGCSLMPKPMTMQENIDRARSDKTKIEDRMSRATGSLTLSDAIARSLRYDYDNVISRLESTQQERNMDISLMGMLPQLSANSGYNKRSNYNSAESVSQGTHEESLQYSYSEVMSHGNGGLGFNWTITDAGISFFQARQQGFRALQAVERRRKGINELVRKTTNDYWRAKVAQEMLPKINRMLGEATVMMEQSRDAMNRHLQNPTTLMDYQQILLSTIRQLQKTRVDLMTAQIDLASDIHAKEGSRFTLTDKLETNRPLDIYGHMDRLELVALTMRPDIRMEAYQKKIDRQDIYKEILRITPGIGAMGNVSFDSNPLLYHNFWGEIGTQAAINLVNIIQSPKEFARAHGNMNISEQKRLALGMAVISQINISAAQYQMNVENLKTVERVHDVGDQMMRISDNANRAGLESDSSRIRHQVIGLLTDISYVQALAEIQSNLAGLYADVGVDIVSPDIDFRNDPHLSEKVAQSIENWRHGVLPDIGDIPGEGNDSIVATATNKGHLQSIKEVWSRRLKAEGDRGIAAEKFINSTNSGSLSGLSGTK